MTPDAALASSILTELLSQDTERQQVAFLVETSASRILYAKQARSALQHAPHSAITRLIQGIYEYDPRFARRILRNRIHTDAAPTEMCHGMVRVSAKALTLVSPGAMTAAPLPRESFSWIDAGLYAPPTSSTAATTSPGFTEMDPSSHEEWLALAERIAGRQDSPQADLPLYERNRKVAALLVSRENRLLHAAVNTNASNRTLHAEVNLLQSYYEKCGHGVPAGSRIYTTLKPCKMCAGMIWHCAEEPFSVSVYFRDFDFGPGARLTVLDPGTFERKRVARSEEELNLHLEHHLPPVPQSS